MALQTAITPKWTAEISTAPTSCNTNITVQNISYSAARAEDQLVIETPPSWASAGFFVLGGYVTSASNIAVTYLNLTGAGYTPTGTTIRFVAL